VQDEFPHGSHHKEVAISISNYTLKHGDTGLIIVGGSMEVQPQLHLDPFEEAILTEKEAERHRKPANTKEVHQWYYLLCYSYTQDLMQSVSHDNASISGNSSCQSINVVPNNFFIKMLLEGARIGNLFERLSFYRMERT
jgi:hypothetical protein